MDLGAITSGGIAIGKLFDPDTPVWALFGKLADLAILSVLWTLCSIPVVTAGAASAALTRCTLNMETGAGNWRARSFFRYFRDNLRNATPLWLIYLVAAILFIFDIMVLSGTEGMTGRVQRVAAVMGLVLWVFTAVWAFPLTSMFDDGLGRTLKNAFYLSVSWLPRTIAMSALWLVPVALLAFVPYILSRIVVLWPVLLFGGTSYLCSKLMVKPLAPYLEEAGLDLSDSGPEEDPEEEM